MVKVSVILMLHAITSLVDTCVNANMAFGGMDESATRSASHFTKDN